MRLSKLAILFSLFSTLAANAAQDNGKMNVLVKVTQGCYLTAIDDVIFNAIDGTFTSDHFSYTGGVTVLCTADVPYALGLGQGENEIDKKRHMKSNAGKTIHYELYSDSDYEKKWLDIASGNEVKSTGNGSQQFYQVYAVIPAGQDPVPVALYQDVVAVTLEF